MNKKELSKKYYRANPERVRKYEKMLLDEWRSFFPSPSYCQICGKELYFNSGNINTSIHFDHRCNGNELIKSSPTQWLKNNRRTPEKEKIWSSCKFGILCNKHNRVLPTRNRKEFVNKLLRYIEGESS